LPECPRLIGAKLKVVSTDIIAAKEEQSIREKSLSFNMNALKDAPCQVAFARLGQFKKTVLLQMPQRGTMLLAMGLSSWKQIH
jgi:hypothetical protein